MPGEQTPAGFIGDAFCDGVSAAVVGGGSGLGAATAGALAQCGAV